MKLKHNQLGLDLFNPKCIENTQKLLDISMVYFVFHGQMLEIKNVKKIQIRRSRFGYESESEYYSSCKNHESESEYSGFGGKDSNPNPNPNIRYNTGE